VLLARLAYHEPIGRRVALAPVLMMSAGALLILDAAGTASWNVLGTLSVAGAALAWGLDRPMPFWHRAL
jgi:hypothetical protein